MRIASLARMMKTDVKRQFSNGIFPFKSGKFAKNLCKSKMEINIQKYPLLFAEMLMYFCSKLTSVSTKFPLKGKVSFQIRLFRRGIVGWAFVSRYHAGCS